MTRFKIPESAFEAIQQLVHLSDPDFEALLDALTTAEPSLENGKFWTHVAPHIEKIDQDVIKAILYEIFNLNDVRTDEPIDEFADAIAEAACEVKSEDFPFEEKDRKILKERLVTIFEGRR